jgi:hypothetical protein
MLLRGWPTHAPTADHHILRSPHAGRPLAPLNFVLQPPPTAQDLGTASEPSTKNYTLKPNLVNMSPNSNHPPTYRHMLLRERPANAPTADPYNPRSYHVGHPLALLNFVLQPPPSAQDLDTALEPTPVRGLHTPLVLAARRSTTDMGRAADLSTRTDNPYRCDRPAPSHSKDQSSAQRPLPLAYADTLVSSALKLIPSPHLNASQPQSSTIRSIMHHHVTRKAFSSRVKYFTCLILAHALTTAMISNPRHPSSPRATILPHTCTSLFAAAHAAGHVAPALYAPFCPISPLADLHDPYANDSHSPHSMPPADTNSPPGARRRRSGGGPDGGCARRPVGIPSPPRGGRWKPRSRAMHGTVEG